MKKELLKEVKKLLNSKEALDCIIKKAKRRIENEKTKIYSIK